VHQPQLAPVSERVDRRLVEAGECAEAGGVAGGEGLLQRGRRVAVVRQADGCAGRVRDATAGVTVVATMANVGVA